MSRLGTEREELGRAEWWLVGSLGEALEFLVHKVGVFCWRRLVASSLVCFSCLLKLMVMAPSTKLSLLLLGKSSSTCESALVLLQQKRGVESQARCSPGLE